jgi:hypothetical protein
LGLYYYQYWGLIFHLKIIIKQTKCVVPKNTY